MKSGDVLQETKCTISPHAGLTAKFSSALPVCEKMGTFPVKKPLRDAQKP